MSRRKMQQHSLKGRVSFFKERTISWNHKNNSVRMIDQTLLPTKLSFIDCKSVDQVVEAIKTLRIRGAPAIGVAGAMGVALSAINHEAKTKKELVREIEPDCLALKSARPTAINLAWGVDKALEHLHSLPDDSDIHTLRRDLVAFVESLADLDVETNKKLSEHGESLFKTGESVLTHCK